MRLSFTKQKYKHSQSGNILLEIVLLLFLVVVLVIFVDKRQNITDWFRLRGYKPPSQVSALASDDTMNAYTTHLFYLNRPKLLSSVAGFRYYCPESKDIIVLGCYHTGQNGIFIYNVQDPTLAGVAQVTAAHEVLHAVYERLSNSDRKRLDSELQSFYNKGLSDSTVSGEIKLYQQTEPNAVYDEMSCTFGTEIKDLSPYLDAYYSRYFSDRIKVVNFYLGYQGQLVSRQISIKGDDTKLTGLNSSIKSNESKLTSMLSQIKLRQSQLYDLQKTNVVAYNQAVPGFNLQVNTYNNLINATQSLIDQYNQLVGTRNSIASQLTTLDSALDTRLDNQAIK